MSIDLQTSYGKAASSEAAATLMIGMHLQRHSTDTNLAARNIWNDLTARTARDMFDANTGRFDILHIADSRTGNLALPANAWLSMSGEAPSAGPKDRIHPGIKRGERVFYAPENNCFADPYGNKGDLLRYVTERKYNNLVFCGNNMSASLLTSAIAAANLTAERQTRLSDDVFNALALGEQPRAKETLFTVAVVVDVASDNGFFHNNADPFAECFGFLAQMHRAGVLLVKADDFARATADGKCDLASIALTLPEARNAYDHAVNRVRHHPSAKDVLARLGNANARTGGRHIAAFAA